MAATVVHSRVKQAVPMFIQEVQLSAIVAGQSEDVAHGGPTGKKVSYVTFEMVTPPDAACAFTPYHDADNDSTANDTCRVKFVAEDGGDLAGLVMKCFFHFKHMGTGGNS